MIRKAQAKFIIIFMSVLLIAFAIMYAVIYSVTYRQTVSNIDKELTGIYNVYAEYGISSVDEQSNVIIITESSTVFDNKTFNETFINTLVQHAENKNLVFGNFGNVYYKFFNVDTESEVLIASDRSNNMSVFYHAAIDILIPMAITYSVLSVFIWLLSYKTFEPVRDTVIKQRQFISDASHELKTPTTIIAANAEVLKGLNDNQWVDNIKSQTERLNTLIADMLTLAKMDEKKLKLNKEKIDLTQLVTDISLSFDAVAYESKKKLTLNVAPSIFIVGDSTSLKNIITILLDNAVKHASEDGEIIVTLKGNGESKATLSVYNTGSFIPDEQSNKIFERFYRGDNSRNRGYGGSGLGLSIAKSIADNNKWKLTAKSKLYESMEITLTIN